MRLTTHRVRPFFYSPIATPIGELIAVVDSAVPDALCMLEFTPLHTVSRWLSRVYAPDTIELVVQEDHPVLCATREYLTRYFQDPATPCAIPIVTRGTPFQQKVWDYLRTIIPGRTTTYGQIADALDIPGAARAVGNACGANPLLLLVPCHRVLATQSLGGYRAGLDRKKYLLAHEQGR